MAITNRADFIEYCLRRLGKPVIEINVSDDQIEDRVDDAIQFWQEFHEDGAPRTYFKHLITADDMANEYITVPDEIVYVKRVFPLNDENSSVSMFDVRYQLHLNDIFDLNFAGSLSNYVQTMQYITTLDMVLNGQTPMRHANREKKIYLDINWAAELAVGRYLIFEVFSLVDPSTVSDVWNDKWLKAYATAQIKHQWGANLAKFEGVQLLGGVTMNGRQILDDALGDIQQLEEEIRLTYEKPVDFMLG